MKNSFGNNIQVTIFGESHGKAVGCIVDGLCAGVPVDEAYIAECLAKRAPSSAADTARREKDQFQILSGVFNGKTTGTAITISIPNEDQHSKDYAATYGKARPSHADFVAHEKYHGCEDYRGGGHFSGRITAGLVAAGALLQGALNKLDIKIDSNILSVCGQTSDFDQRIMEAKMNLDSVGGVTRTVISGMPVGAGEPWFDSVESMISHAVFSIGGVKGIEFGLGFGLADKTGSEVNDQFYMEGSEVKTRTNNNGGINGGITNGMDIVFQCAVKPTPSIAQKQNTIDFLKKQDAELEIQGRHDPAIIRRICPVLNAVSAIVMADILAGKYGNDVFYYGYPDFSK